jgi:hypothetical protein
MVLVLWRLPEVLPCGDSRESVAAPEFQGQTVSGVPRALPVEAEGRL